MIWHAGITKAGAVLSALVPKLFIGALVGVLVLAGALWYTSAQLSKARDTLAAARADVVTCVRANQSAGQAIRELRDAAEANAALRDAAILRQAEALQRIKELEARDREPEIQIIREAADGDACAGAALPDALRLRIAPRGDGVRDGDD